MKKIAIQGVKGSNHHKVVLDCFINNPEIIECSSFDQLVESLLSKSATLGVMALENSIVGSILPNYSLIDTNSLHITGEYYLNISHNLMALEGQNIKDIKEVHSHYMALLQCADFFKKYPHIKLVEDEDTAATAKRIEENKLKGIAAIATKDAASLYNLNILEENIQTLSNNATRFVFVNAKEKLTSEKKFNKASLKFELDHKRGSLAAALNIMSDCNLSLTKIQSLPILDSPWKYSFFVDVVFEQESDYQKAKSVLEIMSTSFKVLGEYKNAK